MKTLLVSYDLRKPGKDYQKLIDHLKFFSTWAKPLESFWLIKTDETAEGVTNDIKNNYIDANDKLFVIDVTSRSAAWTNLPDDVSKWIHSNL